MDIAKMQMQIVQLGNSLTHEGYIDDQFAQLQQLQDESNPDFVADVVGLYFEDSERLLGELTSTLNQEAVDFKMVDAHVHQFKGSSSSIGAQRVKNFCMTFHTMCDAEDREGCLHALEQLKQEYFLVKTKLCTFFEMEQQLLQASRMIPMSE